MTYGKDKSNYQGNKQNNKEPCSTKGRRKYDTFGIVIIVIPFDFY